MASPATAAFLAAWRNLTQRRGHCLVKVDLRTPSNLALRLAGREIATPDGTYELGLADVGPVVAEGDFLTSDISLCSFRFSLLNRRLSAQTSGTSFSLFASHIWHGATVIAYLWEESLTSFSDALQIFSGQVIDFSVQGLTALVQCRQSHTALVELPSQVVSRDKFPRAPEDSMGLPIPIVYGSMLTPPARSPASAYGTFQQGITSAYGLQRGVRGVVVSVGRGNGGEDGRVLFAGHACKTFNSDVAGATPAIDTGERLAEIDPVTAFNGADGTGIDIADVTAGGTYPFTAFFPVPPTEVALTGANDAESPRSAIDTIRDFHDTLLDYDAGQRTVIYRFPSLAPPGKPIDPNDYRVVIGYSTTPGANNWRVEWGHDTAGIAPGSLSPPATTTPDSDTLTGVGPPYTPTDPFDFRENYVRVRFNAAAAGHKVHIYYVAIVVPGFPNTDVVKPASSTALPAVRAAVPERFLARYLAAHPEFAINSPEVTRYKGDFYATLEGYEDDGSGTYTGVANALIERAPDILQHLLQTYCNQSSADIELGASTFGSLVAARALLKTWRKGDMKAAFALSEPIQSTDVIEQIARAALGWAYVSRFDGKWRFIPWYAGAPADYDYTIGFDRRDLTDAEGPAVGMAGDMVNNNIRCSFGYDNWRNRFLHQVSVGPARSQSGHAYRNLRDENMTVIASESDRIDFTDAGGSHTANLTPNDYEPMALAQHLTTIMNGASASDYLNGWGPVIVAGYNDKLDFNDGSVRQATIPAGEYATMEALAAVVGPAMNAAGSSNWSCTYSRTTRKFTIARSAGTCTLLCNTGVAKLTTVFSTLGYGCTANRTGSASYAADYEREEERFFFECLTGTVTLNWETGANGVNAATPRNCATLVGFDSVRDTDAVASHLAHSPKNSREQLLFTSAVRYGNKRPLDMNLQYVNDTDTAREIRNRLMDLTLYPRGPVRFTSERMPDIERGRVVPFSSDWDFVKPYPGVGSDGSWASKRFQVYRVIQNCGPVFETEMEAVEISAA